MEVINKHHKVRLKANNAPALAIWTSRCFAFNKAAIEKWKITQGDYIQFLRDGTKWFLLINEDELGFKITNSSDKKFLKFQSAGVVEYLLKEMRMEPPCRMFLKLSDTYHEGQQLLQILLK